MKKLSAVERPTRRNFVKGAAAASVASFAAAGRARAQGPDVINVGLSPYINQAMFYIAEDSGFFSKVGVQIRMKRFMDGALVVAPMIAGELDVGTMTCNAGYFNALHRGAPFRAFLCSGQAGNGRAVTTVSVRGDHYEAGVRSVKDLAQMKGKVAAVGAAGSVNQYGMASALKLAGLDPVRDVQWQTTVAQPDIVKQLGQKQVDVSDLTYHLAFLAQQQGISRIIASRDEVAPRSQAAIVTASDAMLQQRRPVLVRFAMAFIHAGRIFNQVAGAPARYPETLGLIAKSIIPSDERLLTAVAPHWEWIAEDGMPNSASLMQQQDFWADTFKMVEQKVALDRAFVAGVAEEAARRLDAERPFGPIAIK